MNKKIMIIPDSFKGSMTSQEVATIIGDVIKGKTEYDTIQIPIADGGEGSMACILKSTGGNTKMVRVQSPEGKMIEAGFGVTTDCRGVIEIAESSGITKQSSFLACKATTYGFGELIKAALDDGIRDFLLCLGGSATTDCACGMAAALGVRFFNEKGEAFIPTGETLIDVSEIDITHADSRIQESKFMVMSDVENPLYGENGAAYVYAPQKGATKEEVILLDQGLQHIAKEIERCTGVSCSSIKGAGAAGGAGYGCVAFLNAGIKSGIEAMLDICCFDALVKDCDMIITGEGKLDEQSLMGKVLSGLKKHSLHKPIVSFCGRCDYSTDELLKDHIQAVEIGKGIALEESMKNGSLYLRQAVERFFEGEG